MPVYGYYEIIRAHVCSRDSIPLKRILVHARSRGKTINFSKAAIEDNNLELALCVVTHARFCVRAHSHKSAPSYIELR